jgi:hypothetical protein
MWEGTASRVMAADRPFGEFYNFYSVSPEYFGYILVLQRTRPAARALNTQVGHVIGILTTAHSCPDVTVGDKTFLGASAKFKKRQLS